MKRELIELSCEFSEAIWAGVKWGVAISVTLFFTIGTLRMMGDWLKVVKMIGGAD